MKQNKIK